MKVYELIQILAEYNADTEVVFHVKAEFSADGEVEIDRESEEDWQDVSIDVEFDEDVYYDDIEDNTRKTHHPNITINLAY